MFDSDKAKISKPTILLLIPAIFILFMLISYDNIDISAAEFSGNPFSQTETVMQEAFPFSRSFRQVGVQIKLAMGENLQKGIYITENALRKRLNTPELSYDKMNTHAILKTVDYLNENSIELPIYITIVPTDSGIYLDNNALVAGDVNQRNIIENTYNQFAGRAMPINVYNTLSDNRDRYIYYRTEDNITSTGGYYVYRELIRRMLLERDILPLTAFSINYDNRDYYGRLYQQTPYHNISPDKLMFYNSVKKTNYIVTQTFNNKLHKYSGLYPEGSEFSQYINNCAGTIEIETKSSPELSLLILGDRTAMAYLPFLTNNYRKITFINPYSSKETIDNIKFDEYDQFLIAASIDNYLNSNRIEQTLAELSQQ